MTELISREDLTAAIDSGTVTVVDALGGNDATVERPDGRVLRRATLYGWRR